jgi:hypothetical protein
MAALSTLSGCSSQVDDGPYGFETGPLMNPGQDCTYCHKTGSQYERAPIWTVAGTVYEAPDSPSDQGVEGVAVVMTDAGGSVLETLVTNRAGNFYTSAPLPAGFRVALEYGGERIEMPCPPPSGGCAKCHSLVPIGHAPGRLYVPQGEKSRSNGFDCDAWMPL